jgi:PTH1 family peptidyl-tRNA hydrolase
MAARLVVGLGNPGSQYAGNRHNAGFMVLDRFAAMVDIPLTKKVFSGLCGEGYWQGDKIILLKPQTFMNLSGRSVAEAARFHKIPPAEIIVLHDELDIPFGSLKLKEGGGHGGHNGLRSIIQELGSAGFIRLRIGIDRPSYPDVSGYVLQNFSPAETKHLDDVFDGAVAALETVLKEGLKKGMSLFNNRKFI